MTLTPEEWVMVDTSLKLKIAFPEIQYVVHHHLGFLPEVTVASSTVIVDEC